MAGPPTPAFTQLTAVYSGPAVPTGGVTTLGISTPLGDTQREGIAQEYALALTSWASSSLSVMAVEFKVGPVATGPTYVVATSATGANTDQCVPPNVCVLARKNIDGISGRFAGRQYLMGLPEVVVSQDGNIQAAYRQEIELALDGFIGYLAAQLITSYVFSETSSDPREMSDYSVQAAVATQRRRIRR